MSLAKKLVALFAMIGGLATGPALADNNPTHVPTVRTPLTQAELLHALREGHMTVFGKYPSKNRLAMAWGQVAFENAAGRASFNHNLGNVGSSAPGQLTYFNRGDRHWYRAFFSFEDGAAAYWAVIKHCQPALAAFEWGNPREVAVRLKRCNYFEASLDEYTPGFSSLFYTALNKIIPEDEREQQRQTDELLAAIRRSIENAGPAPTPVAQPPFDVADLVGDGD